MYKTETLKHRKQTYSYERSGGGCAQQIGSMGLRNTNSYT